MAKRKKGLYDHVLPDLEPLPVAPEDAEWQDKVNAKKPDLEALSATELAAKYAAAREERDVINAMLSMVGIEIGALEQMMAASQERFEEGWGLYGAEDNTIVLPDGGTIRVQPEPSPKIEDDEALRVWCLKNGYERKMKLQYKQVDSIVRERLKEGQPAPPGVKVYRYNKIVYTRGK